MQARIAYATEWGGRTWTGLVAEALEALGDLRGVDLLEVGGRSGRMAALFASLGANVTVVDITPVVLESAPREAARLGVAVTARTDPGDLTSVPDAAFDIVFTKSVLVVVRDLPTYLDTVARKLRPGGRVVFIENERGPRFLSIVRRLRHGSANLARFRFFDDAEWGEVRERFAPILVRHRRFRPVGLYVGQV